MDRPTVSMKNQKNSRSPAQASRLLCALAYFGSCQYSLFGWVYHEFFLYTFLVVLFDVIYTVVQLK